MLQLIRRGRAKVRDLRDWGYKREQASDDNSREGSGEIRGRGEQDEDNGSDKEMMGRW